MGLMFDGGRQSNHFPFGFFKLFQFRNCCLIQILIRVNNCFAQMNSVDRMPIPAKMTTLPGPGKGNRMTPTTIVAMPAIKMKSCQAQRNGQLIRLAGCGTGGVLASSMAMHSKILKHQASRTV